MVQCGTSMKGVLDASHDGKPKSHRAIVKASMFSSSSAYNSIFACWKRGLILHTKKPIYEFERIFKGRAGMSKITRPYHLYVLRPEGVDSLVIGGLELHWAILGKDFDWQKFHATFCDVMLNGLENIKKGEYS